jgi:Dolichyl-phosphate-mannose-protein mannosyltransferase
MRNIKTGVTNDRDVVARQRGIVQLICAALAVALSLSSILMLGALSHLKYTSLQMYLIRLYGEERTRRYFTPSVFLSFLARMRLGAALLQVIAIALYALRSQVARYLITFARALSHSLRHQRRSHLNIGGVPAVSLGLITLAGLVLRLHFINQPMRYDESATVLGYASKPFYLGLSIYNEPNNHFFHTLLVHISMMIAGSAEWAVRLPALIAGVMLCLLAYALSLRLSGRTGALWAASLVSTSSILIEYSTNARGFTLICCATVVILIAGLEALTYAAPWWFFVFGLTAIIGFWTIPIFLFPFGGILLWLATESATRRGKFRHVFWHRLALSCGLASAGTLLVYLPAIAVNGPSALFRNQWVAPQNLQSWLSGNESQLRTTSELWTRDLPSGWTLILTIGLLWSLVVYPRLRRLLLSLVTWTVFLLVARRFVPVARIWLMYLPILLVVSASGLSWIFEHLVPQEKRPILGIAGSLLITVVLGEPSLRTNSVLNSTETGVLRSARGIVEVMSTKNVPPETVFRSSISDIPLQYYWWRRTGYRPSNPTSLELQQKVGHPVWCVVNTINGETLEIFSTNNKIKKVEILDHQHFEGAEVYHFSWEQAP